MISPFDSFETTCKTYPDSIAVVFQKRLFTYRELYDKCMSISQLLDQAGVKANTVVAVSMQRSMEMIASILAIMHRKAVFLLLDINQPKRRLQAIISQSKPECILSCNLAGSIKAVPTGEQTPHVFQTAIAYLGFTSGSTGKPKGVAITEASLANCIHYFPDIFGLQPGDRITSFLNCSFDMFIFETVVSLCRGLTIIMSDREESASPRRMLKLIRDNSVSIGHFVPSTLQMLVNCDPHFESLLTLKKIILAGENLSKTLLCSLFEHLNVDIYNAYGLTETTIYSTFCKLKYGEAPLIGTALPGNQIYILDENNQPVECGKTGHIYISGISLYETRLDTQEDKDLLIYHEKKLYNTGDMGLLHESGDIEFLGRQDRQIKLRGYRIHLSEIEHVAADMAGVDNTVANIYKRPSGESTLCLFYTSKYSLNADDIRKHIGNRLPKYMVPVCYIQIASFDYLSNGKLNCRSPKLERLFKERWS